MPTMKTHLMLCVLAAGLCANAVEEADFDFAELKKIAHLQQPDTPMEARLQDVQEVYRVLKRVHAVYKAQVGAPSDDAELVAAVKNATQTLRPLCERLRALTPAELRQLVLLADAIEWQSDWVRDSFLAEHTGADVQPRLCGLEMVAELSDFMGDALQYPQLRAEESAALREFLTLFGGANYLPMPRRLLDHRLAKDYKTAYQFFEDFFAACLLEDDEACARKLGELAPLLDYLLQGGEADRLRVAALADAYVGTMMKHRMRHDLPTLVYPLEGTRLSESEKKRYAAYAPFFEKLPQLNRCFFILMRV